MNIRPLVAAAGGALFAALIILGAGVFWGARVAEAAGGAEGRVFTLSGGSPRPPVAVGA